MKRVVVWLAIFSLLISFFPIPGPIAHAAAINSNNGFEDGLSGWTQFAGADSITVSEEQATEGTRSLKIADAFNNRSYGLESVRQPAVPGSRYTVKANMYVAGPNAGAIGLRFYDASGAPTVSQTSKSAPLNEWQTVVYSAVAPAQAATVSVMLTIGSSNISTVYYDEVYLLDDNYPAQLENGGFEQGRPGWAQTAGAGILNVSADRASEGSRSLKVVDANSTDKYRISSDKLLGIPGKRYTLTASVFLESGSMDLTLNGWNDANTSTFKRSVTASGASAQWQDVSVSFDAPVDTVSLSIEIDSTAANIGTFYVDDVRLTSEGLVQGYITNTETSAPILSALNELFAPEDTAFAAPLGSALSDGSGFYKIEQSFPNGAYVLRTSKAGYETVVQSVTIDDSGTTGSNVQLQAGSPLPTYSIAGRTAEHRTKSPLAGITLTLYYEFDLNFTNPIQTAVSDSQGRFAFPAPQANGRYRVKAEHADYYTTAVTSAVYDAPVADLTISIPERTVLTVEQLPVPPAEHPRLYVRSSDIPALQIRRTDPLLQPAWNKIVEVSDEVAYTAKSSGTTTSMETHSLPTVAQARYVRYVGKGNSAGSLWNSVTEAAVYGAGGSSLPIVGVSWSAAQDEAHDGNAALDGDLATYWTASGAGQWLQFDLGSVRDVYAVGLAWFNGNKRNAFFDLMTSTDGVNWTLSDLGMGLPPGELPPVPANQSNYNPAVRTSIEANAIRYLLDGDPARGHKAVAMLRNNLDTVAFTGLSDFRNIGSTLHMAALVYDWCYPILSADDKVYLLAKIEWLTSQLKIGHPDPNLFGSIESHGSEHMLMKDRLAAGVAIYDEAPQIYNTTALRLFNEYVPARDFYYSAGMHHQGDSYGLTARFDPELSAQLIYTRMGLDPVFSDDQGLIYYRAIYSRRPDGQLLRDGDSFRAGDQLGGQYWKYPLTSMMAASLYKDPYIQQDFLNQYTPGSIDPIAEILLVDPALPVASPGDLPLTRLFPDPMGAMIARTGWNDSGPLVDKQSPEVVAEMKIGGYHFGNHQHMDMGSFQIYYKGALALDSGIYEGVPADYADAHNLSYHKRTIAHNSMLVYDPNETQLYAGTQMTNDGGQRRAGQLNGGRPASNLTELLSRDYEMAKVTGHAFGPDPDQPAFSYIKGDLTGAYSSKVQQFYRSFLFLNTQDSSHPAAMIVFDKVAASNPDFGKYWLLHAEEEPTISGNVSTIARSTKGYSGKLVNETLMPAGATLEKIGGPGHEFDVFGTNYAQATGPNADQLSLEPGAWRVQVSPSAPAEADYFLNVMQVMDGETVPLPVEKMESDEWAGAKVAGTAAFFRKSGNRSDASATLTAPGSEPNLQFVVADLAAGQWEVRGADDQLVETGWATEQSGLLYFQAPAGTYTIERAEASDIAAPLTTAVSDGSVGDDVYNDHPVAITLSATDDQSGVDYTQYRLNGGLWKTAEPNTPITLGEDGSYQVEFRSVDRAGNTEATQRLDYRIDTQGPAIVWLGAADGGAYTSSVSPGAAAYDSSSGLASLSYVLNGQPWTPGQPIIQTGAYVLEALATDHAGHTTASAIHFSILPAATLSASASSLHRGDTVELQFGVAQAAGLMGLDITIAYDANRFSYADAESFSPGTQIVQQIDEPQLGRVRLLTVNLGAESAINGEAAVFSLGFTVNHSAAYGSAAFTVDEATAADGEGREYGLIDASVGVSVLETVDAGPLLALIADAESRYGSAVEGIQTGQFFPGSLAVQKPQLLAEIQIAQGVAASGSSTPQQLQQAHTRLQQAIDAFETYRVAASTGDLNGDGRLSIGDLTVIAYHYGKTADDSPDWTTSGRADINKDGVIDIADLAFVSAKVIGN